MIRRNLSEVIKKMIQKIPPDTSDRRFLIEDLRYFLSRSVECSSKYKAPEETQEWEKVAKKLELYIHKPIHNWEFEVLSIFTTKSIDELKK